jgi:hypothetical protein
MASASLLVAYEGDSTLMGFTSTSQGFFMLGSGPNLNNVSAGGSETDAQTPFQAGTLSNLWCRVLQLQIQPLFLERMGLMVTLLLTLTLVQSN